MGAAAVAGDPSHREGGRPESAQSHPLSRHLLLRPARQPDDARLLLPKSPVRQEFDRRLERGLQRSHLWRDGAYRKCLVRRPCHGSLADKSHFSEEDSPTSGHKRDADEDVFLRGQGPVHREGVGATKGEALQSRKLFREMRRCD